MFRIRRISKTRRVDAARGTRSPRSSHLGGSPALEGAELFDDRLRLVAQPIVDLRGEQVVAEEIFPLLPAADARPAIDRDGWVVERAAYLAAYGRNVHVRVSAASVRSGTFATRIAHSVDRAGANPASITIEIGERFAAQETDEASRFARLVTSTGARIVLNDFALRYPRTDLLGRIRASALKVAPWLVSDIRASAGSMFMLAQVVALADGHGTATIAEGVDDNEMMSTLRLAGVGYAQGFHRQRQG